MPGLVPGIHALGYAGEKDVDGRVKPGHDGGGVLRRQHRAADELALVQIAQRFVGF
jgi:hypothetical protein